MATDANNTKAQKAERRFRMEHMEHMRFNELTWQNWVPMGTERHKRSGVACMTIVLKHIMACLPPDGRSDLYDILDELQDHDPVSECLVPMLAGSNLPDKQWDTVFADLEAGGRGLGFCDLVNSESMIDHCWKKPMFRTVRASALMFKNELGTWNEYEGEEAVEYDVLPGSNGVFRWDGVHPTSRGGKTLSDWINAYFGVFELTSDEEVAKACRAPSAPWVIRLRYSSKAEHLRFHHDLSYFELAIPDGPRPTRIAYRCIAAVKLREREEGNDTVRLYETDGIAYAPKSHQFPIDNDWSVEDGGEFFLFYYRTNVKLVPNEPVPRDTVHPDENREANRRTVLQRLKDDFYKSPSPSPPRVTEEPIHELVNGFHPDRLNRLANDVAVSNQRGFDEANNVAVSNQRGFDGANVTFKQTQKFGKRSNPFSSKGSYASGSASSSKRR
ncbi:hypothetical protein QBC44DRAFT_310651 [Cladorrhinum sp. PSN332]|nr:hypothetical protein QBC44DRAFT_310651 [Cladorrhinum sp. PSN332]